MVWLDTLCLHGWTLEGGPPHASRAQIQRRVGSGFKIKRAEVASTGGTTWSPKVLTAIHLVQGTLFWVLERSK